jgi:[protein-PII] uridylyltransferase
MMTVTRLSASVRTAESDTEFAERLPLDYRSRFNPAEIAAHAHVVAQLGQSSVKVGVCPSRFAGVSGLCVCAEDRPGLLATIGAALSDLGYEVQAGEAYCFDEPASARRLALDVFWIVDPQGKLSDEDSEALRELIEELLSGRREPKARLAVQAPQDPVGTTVRFLEDSDGQLSVLEVETVDRGGLLWAISHALQQAGVQIVGSHIRTKQGRVLDQFTLEDQTGAPIGDQHRLRIQVAVLSAIQL